LGRFNIFTFTLPPLPFVPIYFLSNSNPEVGLTQWEDPFQRFSASGSSVGGRMAASSQSKVPPQHKAPAVPRKDMPFKQRRFLFLWRLRGYNPATSMERPYLQIRVPRNDSRELLQKSIEQVCNANAEENTHKLRIIFEGESGMYPLPPSLPCSIISGSNLTSQ
jgi:hypothetical protein